MAVFAEEFAVPPVPDWPFSPVVPPPFNNNHSYKTTIIILDLFLLDYIDVTLHLTRRFFCFIVIRKNSKYFILSRSKIELDNNDNLAGLRHPADAGRSGRRGGHWKQSLTDRGFPTLVPFLTNEISTVLCL